MTQDTPTPAGLDDLLDALREVDRRLDDAPDDIPERIRLREQQRELRTLAAGLRRRARAPGELARELGRLKRLREEILSGHMSVGHVGGGNGPGGGGIEPRDVFAMNEAIDRAWGLSELDGRIEKLEVELQALRGQP